MVQNYMKVRAVFLGFFFHSLSKALNPKPQTLSKALLTVRLLGAALRRRSPGLAPRCPVGLRGLGPSALFLGAFGRLLRGFRGLKGFGFGV